jgi:predicted Zn-ribbon and HTH transcriptional regulator
MTELLTLERKIALSIERCHRCGRWWGCEDRYREARCPRCAGQLIEQADAERDKAVRSARASKGALARRKRRA